MIQFRSSEYNQTCYPMADREIQCRRVTDLLSDFIEAELSETDAQVVRVHLTQCRHCQQVHDELRLTISFLNRLPKHVPRTTANPEHSEDH